MKKSVFLIVLICLSILLSACSESVPPQHVPFELLDFVVEEDPDYIGSYLIQRYNFTNGSRWEEWGEWTPVDSIFDAKVVCFGYFDRLDGFGTFRARSDYNWIEINYDGSYCLKLEKRK